MDKTDTRHQGCQFLLGKNRGENVLDTPSPHTPLKLLIKALLLLDNASKHPVKDFECDGYSDYLSTNGLKRHQIFKNKNLKKCLSEILCKMNSESSTRLIQTLMIINIKEVICMLAKSYNEIPSSTFAKSWKKVWLEIEDNIEMSKGGNQRAEEPIFHVSESDNNQSMLNDVLLLPNCKNLDENDVVEWILNEYVIFKAVMTEEKELEEEDEVSEEGNSERILSMKREWGSAGVCNDPYQATGHSLTIASAIYVIFMKK
ncbi:hypothetical protein J6590_019190 [Homalodisca vitripennis]|nr:hypothetical protein J6590_019190 [Homalodisca vitripennis]